MTVTERAPGPGDEFEIHTLDQLLSDARRRGGPIGAGAAMVGHLVLVAAVVSVPLLGEAPLPEAGGGVKVFFATPLELPPPPPPPPPPAMRVAVRTPVAEQPEPRSFVAPVETPEEIAFDLGLDLGVALGVEGGMSGGVAGGVPGGVVGGVVGGLPEAPPPAPTLQAVRVGGRIQEPKRIKGAAPKYPEAARMARLQGVVILECLISPRGTVAEVTIVQGQPLLEEAAVDAVRQWVYSPTLMDGVPVPVLMTVTVRFDLGGGR